VSGGAEFFHSDAADWEFFMDKFRENVKTIAAGHSYPVGDFER
jgi:hypothetical protein